MVNHTIPLATMHIVNVLVDCYIDKSTGSR
jgi:hypothetical protein